MEEQTIEVEARESTGSSESRRLRTTGQIPAVVYGAGQDTVPIVVDRASMLEMMRKAGSDNAIYLLKMAGGKTSRHVMIKDMDVNPITRQVRHIDFQRILMDEKVKVQVPVEAIGIPSGVKNEGGMLDFITREVEVECLPGDIPQSLSIDVSHLHIGQHIEAGQLALPDKVLLVEDEDRVILSIAAPRLAEEEEEEEGEELLLEAEAEEPEVIGRTKDDDEGEETEG